MAVTYSTTVKTARMQALVTAIGTGGKLEIGTAGMATVLATFNLANPAGTVSGVRATLATFPQNATAGATGTAAAARVRTSGDVDVLTGLTVGTSGTDVVLDTTTVTSGDTVTLSTVTVDHAA